MRSAAALEEDFLQGVRHSSEERHWEGAMKRQEGEKQIKKVRKKFLRCLLELRVVPK